MRAASWLRFDPDGCFAFALLSSTLFILQPLDFSTFPTVLLLSTALRVGLNVASARLINGGAINNNSGSTMTLTGCTLSGNSSKFGGGLINFSSLTLAHCTLAANS